MRKLILSSFCFGLVLFVAFAVCNLTGTSTVMAAEGKSGLYHEENSWNYYENGKIAVNKTTLVKYNGSWWYVENGKINFGKTTLCKYNGSWWYVKHGKIDFSATTLTMYNGSWWYVKNGKAAGVSNMDADNLRKTEACMYAIGDYMVNKVKNGYDGTHRMLGTYSGINVVVNYIDRIGSTGAEPSEFGIPM